MTASNDSVLERQVLGVAVHELELRMQPAGEREHALGDVGADHRRAALRGRGGDVPGAGRDVEHAGALADRGGLQQRDGEPSGDRHEEVLVARDLPLPTGDLERVEGVHVHRAARVPRATVARPVAWTHLIANRGKPVRSWDPRNPPRRADFEYLGALAATVEEALPEPELTLIVTTEHRALPRYGRDVVVIQRAGPDGRPPAYAHRVLAVFKTHAARPVLAARAGREPAGLTITSVLSYLKVLGAGVPSRLRTRAIVEPIPMGVMWMPDVPSRPIAERPVDVLFRGSVETAERAGLRGRLGTPKNRSRQAMVAALERLRAEAPELSIDVELTPSSTASKHAGPEEYWASLAGAKLCLVPRGDTLETYRLFEAARAGCVIIGERVPPNWFYDPAPVIDMTGWRGLGECVRALLADPAALAERQRGTLEWWEHYAGPEAAGRHVASRLAQCASSSSPAGSPRA